VAGRLHGEAAIVAAPLGWSIEDDRLARAVLSHLANGGDTTDTLEGIVQWWLQKERIDEAVTNVTRVVDALVARGLITECSDERGQRTYGIGAERRDEVKALLERSDP
jgi:hypothetical protein